MNQPPYGGPPGGGYGQPPGGYGQPPGGGGWDQGGGYGQPPGGGFGAPPGGDFGGPPGGFGGFGPPQGPQGTSTLAIVSLICGILGLTCCGFFTGLPAIICGFMARSESERNPNVGGGGMAIAGIVLGFLSIGWTIIAIAFGFLDAITHSLR